MAFVFIGLSVVLARSAIKFHASIQREDARAARLWTQERRYDKTSLDMRVLTVVSGVGALACFVYGLDLLLAQ